MNTKALTAFEAYLDDMFEALPLRVGHRQQMRAELLAHLCAVFDAEFERCGNEDTAIAATLCRFGAAESLQAELYDCVPAWERMVTLVLGQKEKIMWRLFLVLGVVAILVGLAFVMPAVQELVYHEVVTLSVMLLGLGATICVGGVWSFVVGIQRFRVRNV